MCRPDITGLNLFPLIEMHGYGIRHPMFYVKEKGKGMAWMEIIYRMSKVEEMLRQYETVKVLN
jgi:hypothetical protein